MSFRKIVCKCDSLFKNFTWINLASASSKDLPKKPGVYVLRLDVEENEDYLALKNKVKKAYNIAKQLVKKAGWRKLEENWKSKIERIRNIDPFLCPVIYIGGTGKGSGTLRMRFTDLAGIRHVIFPCILSLRLAGVIIYFGFRTVDIGREAFKLEEVLIKEYIKIHKKLPALNIRVKL